ncbi:hypothetical protein CON95_31320 [Bacillus toyonensis]|nr:hypothetical protein CON95_31320 [Bacillus toyonensis]
MNYLSFFLHACNVSENTVYRVCSQDSFLGDSKEGFIICTLLYGTRFLYSFYLQFFVFFFTKHVSKSIL